MTWARSEDTAEFLGRFEKTVAAVSLGRTGLSVSSVGFGSYRVSDAEPEHREALRQALRSGVNLIDTSSNYMDGGSERLIGEVLAESFRAGTLRREQVVVVSKAGYVQGSNLREARRRIQERRPYPEMVEFSPDCWHCISPEFLEDQISRSLARLGLECLDVLLLHNPEYFLKAHPDKETYYARIGRAFAHLEEEVARKRIRFYGISSNTFPEASNRPDFTSLDRVWRLAGEIKKNHHFAVIQFPMNVFESGAAVTRNNGERGSGTGGSAGSAPGVAKTLLERAREYRLGTLVNRPLNSFHRGRLVRLSSFGGHDPVDTKGRLHTVLGRVIELERRQPAPPPGKEPLAWGVLLRDRIDDLSDVLQWREVLAADILPPLALRLERMGAPHAAWANEYRAHLLELFDLVTRTLETLAGEKASILSGQLQALAPELARGPASLSRQVLRVYHGLSGVNCVLVGMRKPQYVEDILQAAAPLPEEQAMAVMTQMHRLP